jgi:high-affinity iron transporter
MTAATSGTQDGSDSNSAKDTSEARHDIRTVNDLNAAPAPGSSVASSTSSAPVAAPRPRNGFNLRKLAQTLVIVVGSVSVAAVLVWQGITAAGNPNPTTATPFPIAALDIAVLVNREGLETILVLAALVAGLRGRTYGYKRPIQLGAALGFSAGIASWFVAITIVGNLMVSYGALAVQAATGLFAVVILLVVMNWFFHSVYWSGWINMQTKMKRSLVAEAAQLGRNTNRILLGLVVLGFASVYRESVEVVLFLQSYYIAMGPTVVYYGAAAGLLLTLAAGYLTFLGHRHLPYRRMLVATGILLTGVLFVMVGEEVNELQLAGWLATTNIPALQGIPAWAGLWFSVFPNVQTFVAQAAALLIVGGAYFASRYRTSKLMNQHLTKEKVGLSQPTKDTTADTRPA